VQHELMNKKIPLEIFTNNPIGSVFMRSR